LTPRPGIVTLGALDSRFKYMKAKYLSIAICVVFLPALPAHDTLAGQPDVSVQILATFDYPGTGNMTLPQKITDRGEIAGYFIDPGGVARGFTRSRPGVFSAPIVEPNDTGNVTQVRGINAAGLLCGYYNDTVSHGFFLSGNTFTEFNYPDAISTFVLGLNDVGDFCGDFDPTTGGRLAFVSIGGTLTSFGVPGATMNSAFDLNSAGEIAGDYLDSGSVTHGFFRDAAGTLTFPIDFPGASATLPFGINDQGVIVGRYTDSAGAEHGFILKMPGRFTSYDYPGATFTSLNGITDRGIVCGRYDDGSGLLHGFIARIR